MDVLNITVQDFAEQVDLVISINIAEKTVSDLKKKINKEYGLPVENQVWIVGERIADDDVIFRDTENEQFYLIICDTIQIAQKGIVKPETKNKEAVKSSTQKADSQQRWKCQNCKYLNKKLQRKCKMCGEYGNFGCNTS